MEHRWGKRLAVDIPVRLSLPLLSAKRGRLTNVSLSGGFITTLVDVRILCRMLVAFEGPWRAQHDAVTVAAYGAKGRERLRGGMVRVRAGRRGRVSQEC
jgi:hypothetical protein